jgi:hypothetical protein
MPFTYTVATACHLMERTQTVLSSYLLITRKERCNKSEYMYVSMESLLPAVVHWLSHLSASDTNIHCGKSNELATE